MSKHPYQKSGPPEITKPLSTITMDIRRVAIVVHLGHYTPHEDTYNQLKHEVKQLLKTSNVTYFDSQLRRLMEGGIVYRNGKSYGLTDLGKKVLPMLEDSFEETRGYLHHEKVHPSNQGLD